ncbi:MAG: NAD-dependent dehydratase [Bacteriovoracaceae bacterium]|nr:NAD-dependent dehydratase [Bacteriovoracaceae bacterium]
MTPYTLITGGAGFIGTNLADRLASSGENVLILDNLSRQGVKANLIWLLQNHQKKIKFVQRDIRSSERLDELVSDASSVFHLAAQVAVTSSLSDPITDFEINTYGTLRLLEALRKLKNPPPLIYTSTNKVYGNLNDVTLQETKTRYEPIESEIKNYGIDESRRLEFSSPYGCSKGAADQYVLDYSKTFGMPAVVFRMSCIYGPHQWGNEDQGWIAHFVKQMLEETPLTLYGNGKQVRDTLFIDDLIDAFLLVREQIQELKTQAFNIGGGPQNTTSLLELLRLLSEKSQHPIDLRYENWRTSDQRYYVSDVRKFMSSTGWFPRVNLDEGINHLIHWMGDLKNIKPQKDSQQIYEAFA